MAGVNISFFSVDLLSHTYRVLAFVTRKLQAKRKCSVVEKTLAATSEGLKQGSRRQGRGVGGGTGQSEGVLTSSGDCARASSVCRDPEMLWFNL